LTRAPNKKNSTSLSMLCFAVRFNTCAWFRTSCYRHLLISNCLKVVFTMHVLQYSDCTTLNRQTSRVFPSHSMSPSSPVTKEDARVRGDGRLMRQSKSDRVSLFHLRIAVQVPHPDGAMAGRGQGYLRNRKLQCVSHSRRPLYAINNSGSAKMPSRWAIFRLLLDIYRVNVRHGGFDILGGSV